MATAGFRVTGRVQGVGFRWWTRSLATELGLTGAVRNLADGSVVVHARGTDARLADLRAGLAQGPPGSRVTEVESVPFSADGIPDEGFDILR